jgi:hypothetical protein
VPASPTAARGLRRPASVRRPSGAPEASLRLPSPASMLGPIFGPILGLILGPIVDASAGRIV